MKEYKIKFDALPAGARFPKVVLKTGKDEAVRRFHPWIFSGAIKKVYGLPADGDFVEVYDNKDDLLATGHFQNGSIAVRIISFGAISPDVEFWTERIGSAWRLRERLGLTGSKNTNCFRLIHGEGDGMPGLIADIYNDAAVIQSHSVGMHINRYDIARALINSSAGMINSVYYKSGETLPKGVSEDERSAYLIGDSFSGEILENDCRFKVDLETGQKTGFFLDQRDNRSLLGSYSDQMSVLNTFCYTGGFSVYSLKAGAKLVHSVDSSRRALDLCSENIRLNGFDTDIHSCISSDVLEFLKTCDSNYDIIILDPPAYAKHISSRHNAVQGYKRLNAMAIKKIAPGGLLFSFSCSQVVDRRLFVSTVMASAIQVGRNARILHHLSQPPDHPVSAFHPEGEYLKGVVFHIE